MEARGVREAHTEPPAVRTGASYWCSVPSCDRNLRDCIPSACMPGTRCRAAWPAPASRTFAWMTFRACVMVGSQLFAPPVVRSTRLRLVTLTTGNDAHHLVNIPWSNRSFHSSGRLMVRLELPMWSGAVVEIGSQSIASVNHRASSANRVRDRGQHGPRCRAEHRPACNDVSNAWSVLLVPPDKHPSGTKVHQYLIAQSSKLLHDWVLAVAIGCSRHEAQVVVFPVFLELA